MLFVRTIFKRQDRWKDKKIVETNVAFLGEKLKPLDELQPPKEEWELDQNGKPKPPWSETHFIGGIRERDGLLIHFASSSDGGRKAIGAVAQAVVQTNAKHPGKAPVVELGEDFYIHSNPQFGKVYYPVFLIVDWVDPPEAAPALTSTAPKTPQIAGPAAAGPKTAPKTALKTSSTTKFRRLRLTRRRASNGPIQRLTASIVPAISSRDSATPSKAKAGAS